MNDKATTLEKKFNHLFDEIEKSRENFHPKFITKEIGKITNISMGVAKIAGLPHVEAEELIRFPGDIFGIAFNIDENEIGAFLLDDYSHLTTGDRVERTHKMINIGVGNELLGRIIDPLGRPLDDLGKIYFSSYLPIERPAPPIISRLPVTEPLQTGIKVIDALIPIGKGQRELILGDRQTGKTTIAINTIINQKDQDVYCVYCAIGQRASTTAQVIDTLRNHQAMEYTVIVVSEGNNPPGLKYITPYAATTIAEHFMQQGKNALIIYDDLTRHARAYRELSLLLRRPPGREAFPSDIFYIHSRLLERATHIEKPGGSLTALPIIETEEENISAYIPTNLISITDGQIYLSPSLFAMGTLPAIDVGKSVSRVGGRAQLPIFRNIVKDLKLNYAQFEERESFVRFGAKLGKETEKIIVYGQRIRACLKQKEIDPFSVPEQILILLVLTYHLLDDIPLKKIEISLQSIKEAAKKIPENIIQKFYTEKSLSENDQNMLISIAKNSLPNYFKTPENKD